MKISELFVILISVIFFVALIPTIVSHVQDTTIIDTTAWNFTGYQGAQTIFLLIPFTVIAGYVISLVVGLVKGTKSNA